MTFTNNGTSISVYCRLIHVVNKLECDSWSNCHNTPLSVKVQTLCICWTQMCESNSNGRRLLSQHLIASRCSWHGLMTKPHQKQFTDQGGLSQRCTLAYIEYLGQRNQAAIQLHMDYWCGAILIPTAFPDHVLELRSSKALVARAQSTGAHA